MFARGEFGIHWKDEGREFPKFRSAPGALALRRVGGADGSVTDWRPDGGERFVNDRFNESGDAGAYEEQAGGEGYIETSDKRHKAELTRVRVRTLLFVG